MASEVSVRLPTALPSELRWPVVAKSVSGEALKIKVWADKAEVKSKSNNTFRFVIPNNSSLWDARDTRICFDLEAEGVWATVASATNSAWAINKNIHSIFSRLRILSGSTEILNIENYNLLCNILMECNSNDDYNNTVGDIMMNTGVFSERAKYVKVNGVGSAFPKRRFCMSLLGTNILENTLPLFVSSPWIIELTIASPEEFFEYAELVGSVYVAPAAITGTAPTDIKLTNITLHTKVLNLSTELDLQLRNEFANNVKTFAFSTYDHFSQISNGTSHQIQIPIKKSVLNGIIAVQRDASEAKDPVHLNKLNGQFLFNDMTNYQYTINGQNIPQDPVETINGAAAMMQELLEFFGKQRLMVGSMSIKDNEWAVSITDKQTSTSTDNNLPCKTIIAMDLRKFSTSLVSGSNTAQGVGSILFKANTADITQVTNGSDNEWHFFGRHVALLSIIGGRVTVVK